MPKYRVNLTTVASTSITIDAEDKESALEEAFEHTPHVCAQCSGWGQRSGIELGEWDVPMENGREVDWVVEDVDE